MLVRDIMRTDIVQIHPQATLEEAARMMLQHRVNTLFVIQSDVLLGVIGLRDLFTAPLPASYASRMPGQRSAEQLLESWRDSIVGNQMNDQPLTVTEEAPATQAAALMVNNGKHPLPVVRDGRVVGTIDRFDIVRAVLAMPELATQEQR
jgi:CBS domain-containing protein